MLACYWCYFGDRAKDILNILEHINLNSTDCTEQIDAVIDGTFDKSSSSDQDVADSEIMEGREVFIEWLKECVEKNLSLLTFTS